MADYIYLTNSGVIVPDTSDVLTTVQNEFKTAFGNDLSVAPETPQGVLITAETVARDSFLRNNAALANQINPNIAGGTFLDAIWALTGGQRAVATKSTVTCNLTGVASTIIPAGVQAKTVTGDLFESITGVTLDASGLGSVEFQSIEYGPIAADVGDLNSIVTGVIGWETVTNPAAAVLGTVEQSDQSVRALRRNTLAIQGVALPEAIISAVYMVEGVKSLTFRENVTAATATIDGVSMVAHSIFVCVDGGTDTDVATALLANKSLGCGWNGSVVVNVLEPVSGQEYEVKFERPDPIAVLVRAYVKANTALIDPETEVRNSIMAYVNGLLDGEPGFTVGSSVSSFELAGAVNRAQPGIYVQKLETTLSSAPSGWSSDEIPIAIFEIATLTALDIQVIIV